MSQGAFRTVSRLRHGYAPAEVDAFFDRARRVYEGKAEGSLTGRDVRGTAFDLVRGGYVTGAVDAALDRLEAAFASRAREEYVARHGREAWTAQLADGARTLDARLTRPDGERFAPAGRGEPAYDRADVDALCRRLVACFDHREPMSADEVRSATFGRRRGAAGYAEAPVDAFLARAVEILLGTE